MTYFKNLSIRGKILSLVIFLIFFELLLSLVAIHFLTNLNKKLDHIVDVSAEKIKLAGMIDTSLFEIVRAEKNLLGWQTSKEVQYYMDRIKQHNSELQESLAKLEALVDAKGLALLKQFEMAFDAYWRVNTEIQRLVYQDAGKLSSEEDKLPGSDLLNFNKKAYELSKTAAREAFELAVESMTGIVNKNDADLDQDKTVSDRNVKTALVFMSILGVFSIVSGLLLGLVV